MLLETLQERAAILYKAKVVSSSQAKVVYHAHSTQNTADTSETRGWRSAWRVSAMVAEGEN
jgi:hypothetical protein